MLDSRKEHDAAELVQKYAPDPKQQPLAVCPNGAILKNPSEAQLARALGMVRIDQEGRTYDVAIVGAGPASLATAVYEASEGLSLDNLIETLKTRLSEMFYGPPARANCIPSVTTLHGPTASLPCDKSEP